MDAQHMGGVLAGAPQGRTQGMPAAGACCLLIQGSVFSCLGTMNSDNCP